MRNEIDPVPNTWYRHAEKGKPFLVIEVDEDEGIIEIQHADGDLEQIDLDAWREMDLEITDEPEDWAGPPEEDDEAEDSVYAGLAEEEWDTPPRKKVKAPATRRERWEEDEDEDDDWEDDSPDDEFDDDDDGDMY